jgi:hypothetical protein
MSGLDYIKRYQEGGDVDNAEESTPPLTAVGKAVPAKGKYALPTATGTTGVDEDLLRRMQEMIAQREAQKGGFMESLKDATAWWSGGMAGPGEALARRQKEREEQEATTFGMRRDLAQYQVSQERARNLRNRLMGVPGQPQAAGATQQPQAAGAVPQPQAAGAAQQQPAGGGLIDLIQDPGLKQVIALQVEQDPDKALNSIQNIVAKDAQATEIMKNIQWARRNGYIKEEDLPGIILLNVAGGASSFKSEEVRRTVDGVPGTYQTTPLKEAAAMAGRGRPPMATTQPTVPTTPAPTTTPAPSGAAAGPQPIAPVQPLPKVGPQATPAAAPAAAPAAPVAAPAAAPTPQARPAAVSAGQPSKEATEIYKATEIKRGEKRAESSEKEREDFKASVGSSDVIDRKVVSDRIATLVKDNPKIAGVISDPKFFNGLAQLVKTGVSTPKGPVGLQDIEEFIFNSLPSTDFPDKIQRRELASYLARFELMNSQLVKGQGQVSNAERQIIRDASVSISDPAEVIYKRAKMVARRAELDSQLSEIYGSKEFVNFEDFKRDPRYKEAFKIYENDLRNIVKEEVFLTKANIKANQVKSKTRPSAEMPSDIKDILKKYPGKQ